MLDFAYKYKGNLTYSQNGEELLLQEIIKRLDLNTGLCVEVGANNGTWCSNTAYLIDQEWSGIMIEADKQAFEACKKHWDPKGSVLSINSFVNRDNVNNLIPETTDILSIDTDGKDYEIFEALLHKVKVVIVEIDSSFLPDQKKFNKEGGSGYLPMVQLGIQKGYFLLCHTGNLIFVDKKYKKLFPEIKGDGITNADLYFDKSWVGK